MFTKRLCQYQAEHVLHRHRYHRRRRLFLPLSTYSARIWFYVHISDTVSFHPSKLNEILQRTGRTEK